MVNALFDTNILIDYLNMIPQARDEFQRYETRAISIITWMEVMIGARAEVLEATRGFLNGFRVVPLDGTIAERTVAIRQAHRLKLPDAIIWATADTQSLLLVTRNTKDFQPDLPGIRIPYQL
ncbi:type II toxin-antitoxin system VapC family toxin [Rhizobium sp. BK251]|uniref:type II toxin-antitoxin system VapC family toxin n=1 Tax=Rhizobium sp. BK251 TaxID=2512125 RepID=UPI00104FAACE|nr:type II toxin-antitoxin system VapC family toxin [Rhizobium sp. BK251]TCL76003.1 hypothetical protein EV286_101550 [Rhizobium sp. BK251]